MKSLSQNTIQLNDTTCDQTKYINGLLLIRDTSKVRIHEYRSVIDKLTEQNKNYQYMLDDVNSALKERTDDANEQGYKAQNLQNKLIIRNKELKVAGVIIIVQTILIFLLK